MLTLGRTLTNYVVFAAVTSMLRYLPESYQAPQRRLAEVLMGVSEQPPHWRTCVGRTIDTLGFAVSALYVDEYYSESDRQQVSGQRMRAAHGRSRVLH